MRFDKSDKNFYKKSDFFRPIFNFSKKILGKRSSEISSGHADCSLHSLLKVLEQTSEVFRWSYQIM